MGRLLSSLLVAVVLLAGCGGADVDISAIPELAETTPAEMEALLASSEAPVVVNVWASWCIPCRSEAPLLERAAAEMGDRVRFVGVNVRDSQEGARGFIAEFSAGAGIEYLFDRNGDVPLALGGSGAVPLTFFFAPGGELSHLQTGVLDERTLALQLDELLGS